MRKNLTKKLFLSVLTLAFAIISLGASTYAWFVMSSDTKVETFQGTVTTGASGLEIAVGEIPTAALSNEQMANLTWRSSAIDIKNDLGWADNQITFDALQNVEDFSGSQFKKLGGVTEGVAANTNYVAFRLYFRLAPNGSTKNGTVYLTDYDLKNAVDAASLPKWYVNKDYKGSDGTTDIEAGENVVYDVVDAARFAIVYGGQYKVYENEAITAGAYQSSGIGQFGAYDYYKNVLGTAPAGYPTDGYYTISQLADDTFDTDGKVVGKSNALNVATISEAAPYAYVDVFVWIEGWDMECINAIFEQTLQVSFKFSLNQARQEKDN